MKRKNNYPQCPFCKSHNTVKNGVIVKRKEKKIIGENQRFLCRSCEKNFYNKVIIPPVDKQRQTLIMYLEGMSLPEIGRFFGVGRDTVKKWFEEYGIDLDTIRPLRNSRIKEIEQIEEVHTIAICDNTNEHNDSEQNTSNRNPKKDYKQQSFNAGFIILERENKVHISSLKQNQTYTLVLRDKKTPEKEAKRIKGRNDSWYNIEM